MKNIIIILCLINSIYAFDIDPDNLYERDVKMLEKFDSAIYNLAIEKIYTKKMSKIYAYIQKNKNRVYTTNPFILRAEAKIYNRNIDYAELSTANNAKYQRYGISAVYTIMDTKQRNEIQNKIIDDNNRILVALDEYNRDLASLEAKKKLMKYKNIVQIRAKAQEKSGIINKEDRIKVIDEIMTTRNEMQILENKIEIDKLKILNFVVPQARAKLSEMLPE